MIETLVKLLIFDKMASSENVFLNAEMDTTT